MSIKISDIADPKVRERVQAALDGKQTVGAVKPVMRLRQSQKPLMNKLEQSWFDYLKANLPLAEAVATLKAQSISVRLCNGVRYKPDISAVVAGRLTFWETKGHKRMKGAARGSIVIKLAAAAYPEFDWYFVWRDGGGWHTQKVLP